MAPFVLMKEPNERKKIFILALCIDMIHDFLEGGGILGNIQEDLNMLYDCFEAVFGVELTSLLKSAKESMNKILLNSKTKSKVDEILKTMKQSIYNKNLKNGPKFAYYKPGNNVTKINTYENIKKEALPFSNSVQLYNILSRKENAAVVKSVQIVENSQHSARAIPALYNLIIREQVASPTLQPRRTVIPINSLARRYNQASQKFPIQLMTNGENEFVYTLFDTNSPISVKLTSVTENIQNTSTKTLNIVKNLFKSNENMNNIGSLHNKLCIQDTNTIIINYYLNHLDKLQKDKKEEQRESFILYMKTFAGKNKHYNPISQKTDKTQWKTILSRMFPITKIKVSYKKFEDFDKKFPTLNVNQTIKLYVSLGLRALNDFLSMQSVNNQFIPNLTGYLANLKSENYKKQNFTPDLELTVKNKTFSSTIVPSVRNVSRAARLFIATSTSKNKGLQKRWLAQYNANTHIPNKNNKNLRSPKISAEFSKSLIASYTSLKSNTDFKLELFSILFRKTCGDLNQIAYAKYKDSIIYGQIPPFPNPNTIITNLYSDLKLNTRMTYSTVQTPANYKKIVNKLQTLHPVRKFKYMQILQLYKNNAYFLTFDEMAAFIALIVNCKVIYTGGSSNLSNQLHEHSYTYNKKVGFATLAPNTYFAQNSNEEN